MENSSAAFCKPLQQFMDEHVSLRADMEHIYEMVEEIQYESGIHAVQLFFSLHKLIAAFTVSLAHHSKREEEALFPMIARHLAKDDKTIEVMEQEHAKAEQHLHDFLSEAEQVSEAEQAGVTFDDELAQSISVNAEQAYSTLIQHFAKEEKTLFPLAESLLTNDEKDRLSSLLQIS